MQERYKIDRTISQDSNNNTSQRLFILSSWSSLTNSGRYDKKCETRSGKVSCSFLWCNYESDIERIIVFPWKKSGLIRQYLFFSWFLVLKLDRHVHKGNIFLFLGLAKKSVHEQIHCTNNEWKFNFEKEKPCCWYIECKVETDWLRQVDEYIFERFSCTQQQMPHYSYACETCRQCTTQFELEVTVPTLEHQAR